MSCLIPAIHSRGEWIEFVYVRVKQKETEAKKS